MEQRTYPVRDTAIREAMQAAYLAKCERNIKAAQNAFSTGEFQPYNGVSQEAMSTPFYIRLELDETSQRRIITEVAEPLERLANKYAIPSIFTGKNDLPPHISLDIGMFKGMTPEQIEKSREWLLSNRSHLNLLAKILTGLTFHMNTLVVAPNSYLCTTVFDDEQGAPYRARVAIEKMMNKAAEGIRKNLQEPAAVTIAPPYRYDDIFHISLSRVTGKAEASQLMQFASEANSTVGENVRNNPIPVKVGKVHMERPLDFYKAFAPQLLKE